VHYKWPLSVLIQKLSTGADPHMMLQEHDATDFAPICPAVNRLGLQYSYCAVFVPLSKPFRSRLTPKNRPSRQARFPSHRDRAAWLWSLRASALRTSIQVYERCHAQSNYCDKKPSKGAPSGLPPPADRHQARRNYTSNAA
jgi:hypothetical protein